MAHEQWKHRLWIVDGHNVIFALPELHRLQAQGERQAARATLERMLRPFALQLGRPLVLVYDGNELAANPEGGEQAGLQIFFSQPPEEADDRIVFLAGQAVARGVPVVVITNDRRSLALRLPADVRVMPVEEFHDRHLRSTAHRDRPREQGLTPRERADIEAWFLGREREILDRARRGARRRERELAERYEAATRAGRAETNDPEDPAVRMKEASARSDEEPVRRWSWALPDHPRPSAAGGGVREAPGRPAQEEPSARKEQDSQSAQDSQKTAATAGSAERAADLSRTARKVRGKRKQERRLAARKARKRKP